MVVVGYGTMKRSDLTGSVVSVTGDELKKSVVTSLDQALQGRAAGVSVTQNSGAPGGGISVSIRGINSLNGNEPLYVIDGVAISGNTDGNSSVLSSINPSDIVSMEILKDASATAIYGSRASNGVVLITTNQGKAGKTKVSYEGYYGLQQLPKKLDVLNLREYAEYQNLRAQVLGFGDREEFKDPSLLGEGTNWQDEIFRNASMHNHQINISGGNEGTTYSLADKYKQFIPRKESIKGVTSQQLQKVNECFKTHDSISKSTLMETFNGVLTEKQVRNLISRMEQSGIIKRIGVGKATKYIKDWDKFKKYI